MSYILEALRKADQERSAGSVPDLEAVHESSSREGGSHRWVWILGVFLLANGLLLAALFSFAGGQLGSRIMAEKLKGPTIRKIFGGILLLFVLKLLQKVFV